MRIRRVFSTRLIPADDYDGVTWNATLFPSGGASLAIKLRSGHPISAPSTLATWANPLASIEEEIPHVGRLIETALTGPPAASHPYPPP